MKGLTATAMAYAMSADGVREHFTGKLLDSVNKAMNDALADPNPNTNSVSVYVGTFTTRVLHLCGLEALKQMKLEVADEIQSNGFTIDWSYIDHVNFYRPQDEFAPSGLTVSW